MLDDVKTVADLFGLNVEQATNWIARLRRKRRDERNEKRRADRRRFAGHTAATNVLSEYYFSESPPLRRYDLQVGDLTIATSIYTQRDYLELNSNPLAIPMTFQDSADAHHTTSEVPQEVKDYAKLVAERLHNSGVQLWDGPTYRLLALSQQEEDALNLTFGSTSYRMHRFRAGLMEDELLAALVECQGQHQPILEARDRYLPIRGLLMPDIESMHETHSRICIGGPGVVFAMRRGAEDDYLIAIQKRSHTVSDAAGKKAVVPKGIHQPLGAKTAASNVYWTIFRELGEELFGGEELQKAGPRVSHDWFFDEAEALAYFRDHEGAYECELISLGFNAMSGNYEMAVLLLVRDAWYWDTYGETMRAMWESREIDLLSTRDTNRIADVLSADDWAGESLYHLCEGLIRLHEYDSTRVRTPELRRTLV